MIQEIQDAIVTELSEIVGVTVTAWQGDIEELLDSPLTLPCIQVIYQNAGFGPRKTMGYRNWDSVMEFLVVLTDKDNASRISAAQDCYTIIESVRSKLAGYEVSGYGSLEPVKEERLMSIGGVVMYGLTYSIDADVMIS